MTLTLDSKVPDGPIDQTWRAWLDGHRLVGPRNRGDYKVIVVGTGLAGASASATLAGMGYKVEAFCFQDSARRAHSIAAQGGINATKDYANEGDSVHRLFVDTIKGGDFRAREANVWRLAELSTQIIDQAVAQGVPFNREYGGLLATRSFGGVLVERTFYCRGQTGQQLLLGAYSRSRSRSPTATPRSSTGTRCSTSSSSTARPAASSCGTSSPARSSAHAADAVVLASGGYTNVYYLSTNAMGSNVTATWRAHKHGALGQPVLHADPPDLHPAVRRLPVEADPDERVAPERRPHLGPARDERGAPPADIPDDERYYYLEERYPPFGNLAPRDIASRAAKVVCDDGLGVGETGRGVYLDFRD